MQKLYKHIEEQHPSQRPGRRFRGSSPLPAEDAQPSLQSEQNAGPLPCRKQASTIDSLESPASRVSLATAASSEQENFSSYGINSSKDGGSHPSSSTILGRDGMLSSLYPPASQQAAGSIPPETDAHSANVSERLPAPSSPIDRLQDSLSHSDTRDKVPTGDAAKLFGQATAEGLSSFMHHEQEPMSPTGSSAAAAAAAGPASSDSDIFPTGSSGSSSP